MMTAQHKIPITILICDDDEDDRMLTEQALEDAHISNRICFVNDGEQLLDYLYQRGQYAGETGKAPRPGLILLDLNMPKLDGREALKTIKEDPNLSRHSGRSALDVTASTKTSRLPTLPARRQLIHHEAGDLLRTRRGDERARPLLARDRRASTRADISSRERGRSRNIEGASELLRRALDVCLCAQREIRRRDIRRARMSRVARCMRDSSPGDRRHRTARYHRCSRASRRRSRSRRPRR